MFVASSKGPKKFFPCQTKAFFQGQRGRDEGVRLALCRPRIRFTSSHFLQDPRTISCAEDQFQSSHVYQGATYSRCTIVKLVKTDEKSATPYFFLD